MITKEEQAILDLHVYLFPEDYPADHPTVVDHYYFDPERDDCFQWNAGTIEVAAQTVDRVVRDIQKRETKPRPGAGVTVADKQYTVIVAGEVVHVTASDMELAKFRACDDLGIDPEEQGCLVFAGHHAELVRVPGRLN